MDWEVVLLKQALTLAMHSCYLELAHEDLLECWCFGYMLLLLMLTDFGHLDGAGSAAELMLELVDAAEAMNQSKP